LLVRLVASETVTAGGTRKATWLVFSGHKWVSLKDVPDAEFTQLDPGPGTIWETAATVPVAPGAWLQKVVTTPLREQRRDPMSYLSNEVRGARRHVERAYFRVNTRGALRAFILDDVPAEVRESE
jgi:hypothetical protein